MFFQAWVPSSPSSGLALSCCSLWRNGIILASMRGESVWAVTHTRGNPWRMIKSILQPGRQQCGAFSLTPYWLLFSREAHERAKYTLQPCDSVSHRGGMRQRGMKADWKDSGRSTVRNSWKENPSQCGPALRQKAPLWINNESFQKRTKICSSLLQYRKKVLMCWNESLFYGILVNVLLLVHQTIFSSDEWWYKMTIQEA